MKKILISLLLFWCVSAAASTFQHVNKLIDSRDGGYEHAYAPSIIYMDGKFHIFYCSTGDPTNQSVFDPATNIPVGSWDQIRYAWSNDGRSWSAPKIVLKVSGGMGERAACDPSVVKFNRGDGDYFYLYYSGNALDVQTVMFVARSSTIDGVYAKWTGTAWAVDSQNPQVIIGPKNSTRDKRAASDPVPQYGAGQQTVVNVQGVLYSWFTDTTDPSSPAQTYFSVSKDGVTWKASTSPGEMRSRIATNITAFSADVKYDDALKKFVLFQIENNHQDNTSLAKRYSDDGITWYSGQGASKVIGGLETICDAACFPDYTHNVGVSGDQYGHLIGDTVLVVYGAPVDRFHGSFDFTTCKPSGNDKPCWGYWDLAGSVINAKGATWNAIPWGWQGNGNGIAANVVTGVGDNFKSLSGDFDGDGLADPGVVDMHTGRWYIRSSRTGQQGVPGIPWGWQWYGWSADIEIACADYDGDGITDLAVVNRAIGRWYVKSSATGGNGVPGTPWGWEWVGMTRQFDIVRGDFDGDKKADKAIVNRTTGEWFVISSATNGNGLPNIPWAWKWQGWSADLEVACADYDGDGKTDQAVVNRATGEWFVISSINWQAGVPGTPWPWQWTGMTRQLDIVRGDFDGDKKADKAIVNRATGQWFVISSATNVSGLPDIQWGWTWGGMTSQFDVVPGDYDGDGKTDRAIRDRSTGRWFVIGSKPFKIY